LVVGFDYDGDKVIAKLEETMLPNGLGYVFVSGTKGRFF
jgi:hypothetical protein